MSVFFRRKLCFPFIVSESKALEQIYAQITVCYDHFVWCANCGMIMIILYDLVFFMISVGYDFECWHVWSSSLSTIFNWSLNQDSRSVKVYPFR